MLTRVHTISRMLSILLTAVAFSSSARAQGGEAYIIGKGDQLLVTVWGYNEFTTTATVKDNAMFAMPLLGDMKAAGLTKEEFISSLQKRLAEYVQGEPRITISVLSSIGQRATILGAVNRPDNYPISSEVTLIELVSMAGGYTSDARLKKIKIFHKDKLQPPTEVDLDYYIERSDIENVPRIKAGDIVFVPRQENLVKEFGEFLRDVAFFFTLLRITDTAR